MKIFYTVVIVVISIRVSATSYYLSGKGNDQHSGTNALAPWRSLRKLSEVIRSLQPGDSVLFERGSVFNGDLRISVSGQLNKEIYVGAYGSGISPVVSGSIEVNNWTAFSGNIWVADCKECSAEPGNLFFDGKFQPLGRYPNEGYLTLSCASLCKTTLTDDQLSFADGYWDGAEVVARSSRWTLDNLPVLNYSRKTFYFSIPASYSLPNRYGYFIQKHLGTLDKPGEWFFDKASKKIFLYCKDGDKPGNHTVEVSVIDMGLNISKAGFITIENLAFRFQRIAGIQIRYSANISVRNCLVEYSGNNGLEVISCRGPVIENCRMISANNNGVEWIDNVNGSFIRNAILRTGLHPGRGMSGNATYIGLNITATNPLFGKNLFQYNSLDSTGYIGIDFRTGGTSIKNNLISNFCMIKDDGAGIYTWGNSYGDNLVDGNIILNGVGSGEGTDDPDQVWANGIYIDDRSSDINVINNTVAYCGTTGIFIHNARRLSIRGNTLFANGTRLTNKENAQLSIKLDNLVPENERKNLALRITENLFGARKENNHCIYLRAETEGDLKTLGLFSQNQYYASQDLIIARLYGHQNICDAKEELSLSAWQQCTGNDNDSQFKIVDGEQNLPAGPNLIANSSMTTNIAGWIAWPSQVIVVQDKKIEIDGPSLKVQFPAGRREALLYHSGFSLNKNKMYRLSFSARGNLNSRIEFVPLVASPPWDAIDDYACFSMDTVFKSYSYYFKPNKSSKEARVNFKSDATFWIDNVTLTEIGPKTENEGEPLHLIYNATEKLKAVHPVEKFAGLDGNQVPDPVLLQSFTSIILQKLK